LTVALDFTLGDDLIQLQQSVRKASRTGERRRARPSRETVEESWRLLVEVGALANLVPRSFGGTERGLLPLALVVEELSAAGLGANLAVLTAVVTILIARHGSARLREEHLPAVASGSRRYCLAVTEPEAGFNILRATTFARRDGNCYRLTGRKRYISGADIADFMLVLARTLSAEECQSRNLPKSAGLSLLLVDTRAKGITRRPIAAHGDGGLTPFELTFDNVEVSADSRVAEEHAAAGPMFAAFNAERVLFAAGGLGVSQYCLDRACEHAKKREVFRGPIGAYQSIQHPLAETKVLQEAVRLATYRAGWAFDCGDDPQRVSVYANSAKLLAAQLALKAVDAAIDAFGGKGFDEEYGLIHLWEQARLMKTSPISDALILNGIAEGVLGLPRSY
jgi:alkylation response protein AidB-like acyl-CoA dehydrogenase